MSIKLLPEQVQADVRDTQQEQQRIHSQIQENVRNLNEEWSKWTTPQKIKGDSMIGARINDGDIVFIRKQPDVENGEIAAVLIDGEATLKRVYKKKNSLVFQAENPKYAPLVCSAETCDECIIMGKAVTFQSDVV